MPFPDTTSLDDLILTNKQFTPLIRSAMKCRHITCAELSRQTGITKSKLSRGLNGKAHLDLPTIQQICRCVGIDMQRALLAIAHFGDWSQYYDPDIEVVADLIRELPATLAAARDGCDRARISDHGIKIIAKHVGAMIADNDRKVTERRDAFTVERELQRTG